MRDLRYRDGQVSPSRPSATISRPATPSELLSDKTVIDGLLAGIAITEAEGVVSGMAMKFTSLAQIETNQFVPADDRLYLQEAEDLGAGVPRQRCHDHLAHFPQVAADATMAKNRSAGGLSLRQTRTGRSKHYRIYQLDTADHILTGHSIVCRSDAEAMDAARSLAGRAAAVEVWESTRRVGRLSSTRRIAAAANQAAFARVGDQVSIHHIASSPAPRSGSATRLQLGNGVGECP